MKTSKPEESAHEAPADLFFKIKNVDIPILSFG